MTHEDENNARVSESENDRSYVCYYGVANIGNLDGADNHSFNFGIIILKSINARRKIQFFV